MGAHAAWEVPRVLEETGCVLEETTGGGIGAALGKGMSTNNFESIATDDLGRVQGGSRLSDASHRAQELGLRITSTTGGRHAPRSYHYQGRAIDVGGSLAAMRQFYTEMSRTNPTELFYDPMGGMKHGRNIGAIGGHGNHVHVAY